FAAEEARRYRRTMEEFEAAEGRELTKGHNFKPHLLFTWVDEIVHHPAIVDAVEDVIGPDIRLFHLSVWPKNAGDAAYVSWHQDATYFGLEPPVQVTAWVALTDASIEAVRPRPGRRAATPRRCDREIGRDLESSRWPTAISRRAPGTSCPTTAPAVSRSRGSAARSTALCSSPSAVGGAGSLEVAPG